MANELSIQHLRPENGPSIEQLEEYRALMTELVRSLRKGVKVTSRFPGSEFMLPGNLTEWSRPDADGHTHIERDRNVSASYKYLGMGAHKLCVLESDSLLMEDRPRFTTQRRVFRFGWDNSGVYDSQALHTEIISNATTDLTLAPKESGVVLVSELDEHNDPFRYGEHMLTSEVDVDHLLYRTDCYGQDYLAEISDALAS